MVSTDVGAQQTPGSIPKYYSSLYQSEALIDIQTSNGQKTWLLHVSYGTNVSMYIRFERTVISLVLFLGKNILIEAGKAWMLFLLRSLAKKNSCSVMRLLC